jgi:hypothetical protein
MGEFKYMFMKKGEARYERNEQAKIKIPHFGGKSYIAENHSDIHHDAGCIDFTVVVCCVLFIFRTFLNFLGGLLCTFISMKKSGLFSG